MKKVLCYVAYSAEMPVMVNEIGCINYDMGLFENQQDATVFARLLKNILKKDDKLFNVRWTQEFLIKEVYIPESQVTQHKIYTDVQHAVNSDWFLNRYQKQKGAISLQLLVKQAMEEISTETNLCR